jgi:uncharacterized protein YcbK (DUF882 family)
VKVSPALLEALERLRSDIGRPIRIVSGYRCAEHNRRVGGAQYSQHLYGRAADLVRGVATVQDALAAGFGGVGFRGQWAVHVDVRAGKPIVFPD